MKIFLFYFLTGLLACVFHFQNVPSSEHSRLVVSVSGLKHTEGQIGILLFDKGEGFPSSREKAVREMLLPINQDELSHVFTDLPFGEYAVSVMHDENGNNQLDTNLFGIPTEGNGVSNNVKSWLGPPKFKQAAFKVNSPSHSITVKIKY